MKNGAESALRDVVSEIPISMLLLYGEQSTVYPSDLGEWMHS